MKLHLPKALFVALLTAVCSSAFAATYADWTITSNESGQTVYSTTLEGEYDILLGAAAITTNKSQPYTITVETTKSDGWSLASNNNGTIIVGTGTGNQGSNNQFTVRYSKDNQGNYKAKGWINIWDYSPAALSSTLTAGEQLTTIGTTIGVNADGRIQIATSANSQLVNASGEYIVNDGNTPYGNCYNYANLTNKGTGLSDYSKVTTNVTVAKNTNEVSGVTIGNLTAVDTTVALSNVEMLGTLTTTGTGAFNLSGAVDVENIDYTNEHAIEGANAFAQATFSKQIATETSTLNLNNVTWSFNHKVSADAQYAHGTISGTAETWNYFVNAGGTVNVTADSDVNKATHFTVNQAATLNLGAGAQLDHAKLEANADIVLSGSGLYIAGDAKTLGDHVSLADNWTGTVQLTGTLDTKKNFFETIGKNGATIEMKGVSDWFARWDGTMSSNIKLTNNGNTAAWTNGAFTSGDTLPTATMSGTWSGDGTFYVNVSNNANGHIQYAYTGDVSAWTGVFKAKSGTGSKGYVSLKFAENATNVNIEIQKEAGVLNVIADTNASFSKKITATKMTVNAGKSVALGSYDHAISELIVENGASVSTTHSAQAGFVNGTVLVKSGSTLTLGGTGNDGLGWGSGATTAVTLQGEAGHTATMHFAFTGNILTLKSNLNLNGYSSITSATSQSFNSFGGKITATGTNNIIDPELKLRKNITVEVTGAQDTLTMGAIGYQDDQHDANVTLTKAGAGVLTISGAINGHYASGNIATIAGDGANTIISGATIANAKLSHVTLSTDAHTVSGTVLAENSTLANTTVSEGAALTLSGATGITAASAVVERTEHARTEAGNGLGTFTATTALADTIKGDGTLSVDAVTSWTVNGYEATYSAGTLSFGGASDIYYVNDSNTALTVTSDGQLATGNTTINDYVAINNGAALALENGTTLTLTNAAGDKGIWMQKDTSLTVAEGATLSVAGDVKIEAADENGATITAAGDDNQIGTNAYHDKVTMSNAAITVANGVLRDYKVVGGSVTVDKTDATTSINSALSGTTTLTVVDGSVATFTKDATVASVSGDGALSLGAHELTVVGDASIGAITLGSGATITLHEHEGVLTTSTVTVAGEGATLNGDLVVLNGGTLDFSAGQALTMGCGVEIGDNVTVVIDAAMLESIQQGTAMTIITNVDADAITLGSNINFVDAQGQALGGGLYLDTVATADNKLAIVVAPEPATTTLSLLALAGLMARRRRH